VQIHTIVWNYKEMNVAMIGECVDDGDDDEDRYCGLQDPCYV
jgi:hypothetical protein